jgi:uncharacterized FlgJ-related protein
MKEICIKISQPIFFSKLDKEFFLEWFKNNYPDDTFTTDKDFFTVTVKYKLKLLRPDLHRLSTLLKRYNLRLINSNELKQALFKRFREYIEETEDKIRNGRQYISTPDK